MLTSHVTLEESREPPLQVFISTSVKWGRSHPFCRLAVRIYLKADKVPDLRVELSERQLAFLLLNFLKVHIKC